MTRRSQWVLAALFAILLVVALAPSNRYRRYRQSTPHVQQIIPNFDSELPFVNLVVVVTSPHAWLDRRTLIRDQWPRNLKLLTGNHTAVLKFAIGRQGLDAGAIVEAHSEHDTYHDLLFLDCKDLDDTLLFDSNWGIEAGPSSTTMKVKLSIVWAVEQFRFDYFFRLGDDSYFRVDKFFDVSRSFPLQNALIGKVMKAPILGMDQEYVQGMGYAITYDICVFIKSATPWLLVSAPEDGVVARWMFRV